MNKCYCVCMEFIKNRLMKIRSDRLLLISFLVAAAELACHVQELNLSGFHVAEIIRAVFCIVYILVAFLLCSRNAIYYAFSVMALVILFFNKYTNYTSFFILAITVQKQPRLKMPLFLLYGADVIICLFVGHRMAQHAISHIINCAWIYLVLNMDFDKHSKLNLTLDERLILDEWLEVRDLKAVECFSRNTVFDKLKEARTRNKASSNEELKSRYADEIGSQE